MSCDHNNQPHPRLTVRDDFHFLLRMSCKSFLECNECGCRKEREHRAQLFLLFRAKVLTWSNTVLVRSAYIYIVCRACIWEHKAAGFVGRIGGEMRADVSNHQLWG